jgi:hypothetical protein
VTLVALPLFKVELSYLVRHGRRWTVLEHLLLWALSREPRGLADLAYETNMPQRLVVESLVNLLKVGWIELTTVDRAGVPGAVLFTANGRGRSASGLSELPYAFDLEKRFSALYVDRLTASVLREDQIQLRHRDQLDRRGTIILHPDFDKYDVSPGRFFDSLAMRADDQFERSLDRRLISVAQYALVEVIGDEVAGLPPDAPARLSEVILRRIPLSRRSPDERSEFGRQRRSSCLTDRPKFGPAEIGPGDVLMSRIRARSRAASPTTRCQPSFGTASVSRATRPGPMRKSSSRTRGRTAPSRPWSDPAIGCRRTTPAWKCQCG